MPALSDIAVVILNWNGQKWLETFLPSVVSHSGDAAIIVADNASTDTSVAWLRQYFPQVQCICLENNYGFAEGYNRALQQIQQPYYLLLNSDVEVSPHYLEPLLEMLHTQPHIAACQPKVLAQQAPQRFEYAGAAGGFLDILAYPFCRGRIFEVCEHDRQQYDDAVEIFWASGCALFIRSELYHRWGGFDGDFFAHMEEIDLCWRLKNAGYGIAVCPQSVVYHVGGGTLAAANPFKTYLNFRNNWAMMLKNMPARRLWWVLPLRLKLDMLAAIQQLMKGNKKAAFAIVKAVWRAVGSLPQQWRKRQELRHLRRRYALAAPNEKGLYRRSVLWQFFVRKCRTFAQLPNMQS